MTMEIPDPCSSGGSGTQSPERSTRQQRPLPNQGHQQQDDNNNIKTSNGGDLGSLEYRDKVYFTKEKEKEKQKSKRQGVQQHYDSLVKLVPVLKNRTRKTPLTKSMILRSTVQFINLLKEDSMSSSLLLNEELRQEQDRNNMLKKELEMWTDKVQQLRARNPTQEASTRYGSRTSIT